MGGKQEGPAEALDLQPPRGLRLEAVPEAPRREQGERRDHDHNDSAENEQGFQRAAAARDSPDVGGRGRNEHERIELRTHRQPEKTEREQVAAGQERCERADRQCRRKEVVGVQRDRPNRERRERKKRGCGVEA